MSKITMKTNKTDMFAAYQDAIRELELTKRQLADAMTEKGVLLNQLASQEPSIPQHFQESYAALADECKQLIAENQRLVESCAAAHKRCDALEAIVAKSSAPKPAPKPQAPVSDIESVSPVIQITDADREVYRKFNALPREQRLAIIAWARPTFGNVGIDNIQAVRAAWHESQAQSVA